MTAPGSPLSAFFRSIRWPADPAVDEQTARALLSAVVVCEMDAVIALDGDLKVILFNRAAEKIFRCRAGDVLGGTIDRFIPEALREKHRDAIRRLGASTDSCRRIEGDRVVTGLRADGESFPLEASISHVASGAQHLYTVFLRDVSQRREYELTIEESMIQLRSLTAHMHRMRDEERRRMARELHDDLGQLHAAIRMDVAALRDQLVHAPAALTDLLQSLDRVSARAVDSTRRLIEDLRPAALEENDLTGAVAELCAEFGRRHGIACGFHRADASTAGEEPIAFAAFRLVQESLVNVAKHAKASRVDVRMGREGDGLQLEIADDGQGMSSGASSADGKYGLIGMRERTLGMGGRFTVESSPGLGTRIRAWLPMSPPTDR